MPTFDRLPDSLRGYCIYTGKTWPESALSREHIIPRSLGGTHSPTIWVNRKTNNVFGSKIDAKITNDPLISFGCRDADARGYSKKARIPEWRGAVRWGSGQPVGSGEGRYTLRFPSAGATAYDCRTRRFVPVASNGSALVIWRFPIDHVARLKFTLKTLLGIGYVLSPYNFSNCLDADFIRNALNAPISLSENHKEGGLSFTDSFLDNTVEGRARDLAIRNFLERKSKTTALIHQTDSLLNWSISCVGYFVGSVWLPAANQLLPNVSNGDGLLITFDRLGSSVSHVPRTEIPF
ncbi:HNH endonuclease [Rhodovulum sp. PH10]|uniref:HNH endonuclease n=1 Tax=Rhodovulum sp. PH10 TaxID=1187851 RepID=UPI000A061220|nr:HNH endonuclease [Rhodovulum sp. PH10]